MAKILVVDDAMFMRTVLKKMLEEMGHEVIGEAKNGKEAIEKTVELNPEIVTLDITMPGMDGLTALPKILEKKSDTKVIMASAMGQKGMVIKAIKEGAKDFIVKPFDQEAVEKSIKKVI